MTVFCLLWNTQACARYAFPLFWPQKARQLFMYECRDCSLTISGLNSRQSLVSNFNRILVSDVLVYR